MSMRQGRPSSLDGIKRHAKKIKAEQGLQHARALDEAAKLAGYVNFAHANGTLRSTGPRPPGRQSPPPPTREKPMPTTMTNSKFLENARAVWVSAVGEASGSNPNASIEWLGPSAIADALTPALGKNRNHAHLPDGGGRDFLAVDFSHEPGCLDFHVSDRCIYRMKPRRLVLERIEPDLAQSFFLLELDALKPLLPAEDRRRDRFGQEEMVEVGPDEHYERSAWDEGETPNGEELPEDAKLLVRFFGGKVLFVTKGSIWNGSRVTYDGRHARMGAADIRSAIEGVIERQASA
ncbi:MAG: hypothetical protein K2X54_03170 [Methylobacterium organophilum]|nr:hypothetical protein [Methylobacterium organophilum]